MHRLVVFGALLLTARFASAQDSSDPLASIPYQQRRTLAEYKAPSDALLALQKRSGDWKSRRIGLGSFAQFYPTLDSGGSSLMYLGSGYDYTDDVASGMTKSKLFDPSQVGISNFPPNEHWDYIVAAQWIGDSRRRGIHYAVIDAKSQQVALEETLPLPEQWDRGNAHVDPLGMQASTDNLRERDKVMTDFGGYLAYKIAAMLAGGGQ
jgi:hypothetical protein